METQHLIGALLLGRLLRYGKWIAGLRLLRGRRSACSARPAKDQPLYRVLDGQRLPVACAVSARPAYIRRTATREPDRDAVVRCGLPRAASCRFNSLPLRFDVSPTGLDPIPAFSWDCRMCLCWVLGLGIP